MSIDASTKPVGLDVQDDDSLDHWVCCDPNRARCGADVGDLEWGPGIDTPGDCIVCISLRPRPCGKPFCRIRSWWRNRMSPP